MELLVNDLSLHGQFSDIDSFRAAMNRLMRMREIAKRFDRELRCNKMLRLAQVTPAQSLPQVIGRFRRDEQRSVMQWLDRGPYWEDDRLHGSDDYLECDEGIVTDTALGEAAFSCIHGSERRLASFAPSDWNESPIRVTWTPGKGLPRPFDVQNYSDPGELEAVLSAAPGPIASWDQLAGAARQRFQRLTFSDGCFDFLHGVPFGDGSSRHLLRLLDTLNELRGCVDSTGRRTERGNQIYQEHFTGQKAWFSDSSASEKSEFQKDLTFQHPELGGASIFCSWHAKVKTPQLRIHFSWPVPAEQPLYVVYIGPKITKR